MQALRLAELTIARLALMCQAAGVASLGWEARDRTAGWVLRHVEVDKVTRVTRCADHELEQTLERLAQERRGGVGS